MTDSSWNNDNNNNNNPKRLVSLMAHSDDDDDDDDDNGVVHSRNISSSSVKNQPRLQVKDNDIKVLTTPIMKETKSKFNIATTTTTAGKSTSSKKKQVSIVDSKMKKESIRTSALTTTSTPTTAVNTNTTTTTTPPKWHQYRRDITDPIFCDTTASISAISYGARRLPEIKDLWMSCHLNSNYNDSNTITPSSSTTALLLDDNNNTNIFHNNIMTSTSLLKSYHSSGCKISSRHLRKRTTSYQNKQRRYQKHLNNNKMKQRQRNEENSDKNGCSVSASRLKRRQNKNILSKTLHENWRHNVNDNRNGVDKEIKTNEHREDTIISQQITSSINDQSHNIVKHTTDDNKLVQYNWMMTHMWHTKRFYMSKIPLWGWKIPMIHNNRGTQASIRLVSSSSTLKTATTKWKERKKKRKIDNNIVTDSSVGDYDTTKEKNITDNKKKSDDDDDDDDDGGDIDNGDDLIHSTSNSKNGLPKCLLYDATWCMQPIWFHINYNNDDDDNNNTTTDEEEEVMLDLWIRMMTSYIPNFQRPASSLSSLTNQQSGEGMIHEKNAFPCKAIGPIHWFYTNQPIMMSQSHHDNNNKNSEQQLNNDITMTEKKEKNVETLITNSTKRNMKEQNVYIYFWLHPSIHQEILLLWKNDWIAVNRHHYYNENNTSQSCRIVGPYSGVDGGITCLKLRGLHSTTKLCNILLSINNNHVNNTNKKMKDPSNDQNINSDINNSKSDTTNSNMVVKIPITESIVSKKLTPRIDESFLSWTRSNSNESNMSNHIIGPQHLAIFMSSSSSDTVSTNDDDHQQQQHHYPIRCIQCIRPRDPSLRNNYGVCGYDIFCHPDYVKEIFIKLIIQEGVCPIGYTDESSLGLECDPPILIFPRDYPDTKQGQLYWNGQSTIWNTIRSYWEGGGGRIKDSSSKYPNNQPNILSVLLNPVVQEEGTPETITKTTSADGVVSSTPVVVQVPNMAITSENFVVVVRGMFGEPFQQALNNASPSSNSLQRSSSNTKRRMRRPMSSVRSIVIAPPISKEQIEYHNVYANSLLKSLTLPALLICHIQVIGKGRLKSLDQIYAPSSSSSTLSSSLTSKVTSDVNSDDMIKDMIRLGFVTFGAFSTSRGRFHGIGIIRASSFLKSLFLIPSTSSRPATIANLSSDELPSSSSFIPSSTAFRISNDLSSSKTKSVQLRVFIHSNDIDHLYEAIIKIII